MEGIRNRDCKCTIVVAVTAVLDHLGEEVHLPQQVAEHGVDVVHLFKSNNTSVRHAMKR